MTTKKQSLSGVLNLRVDDALSREIDRIAAVEGTSASEAARKLLGHGVEVQRQVEASYLRLPYSLDREKTTGRIVIEAEWRPYTRRELWEQERELEAKIEEAEDYGG
jgi:hypothetical protein